MEEALHAKFKPLFEELGKLSPTRLVNHTALAGDDPPPYTHPRRVVSAQRVCIAKEMLDANVTKSVFSP